MEVERHIDYTLEDLVLFIHGNHYCLNYLELFIQMQYVTSLKVIRALKILDCRFKKMGNGQHKQRNKYERTIDDSHQ
jgi:hypothetical protein